MGNWEPRGAVGEGQASQRAHLPAAQGVGRGAGGDEMRRESQAGLVVGGGLSCQAREFGFSYAE